MSAKTNANVVVKPMDPAETLRSERTLIIADLEAADRQLARLAEAQNDEELAFSWKSTGLAKKKSRPSRTRVASGCEGPQPQLDPKAGVRFTERIGASCRTRQRRQSRPSPQRSFSEASPLRLRLVQVDAEMRTLKIVSV